MKTETIIGFILAVITLASSTIEASAELFGLSQQVIMIIGLAVGFLSSVWEMFKRLPENKAKQFAEFYAGDTETMKMSHDKDVHIAFNQWKELQKA